MARPLALRLPAAEIVAGCVAAWALVGIDAAHRDLWRGVSVARHVVSAVALQTVPGVLLGVLGWLGARLERVVVTRAHGGLVGRLVFWGVVAALASTSVAWWAFSGHSASTHGKLARVAPFAIVLAAGLFGAAVAWIAIGAAKARSNLVLAVVAAALVLAGAAIAWADLGILVALYARLHAALEAVAATFFAVAAWLVLRRTTSPTSERILAVLAAATVVWTLVFSVVRRVRAHVEDALSHAWREPEYVGRTLQWVELAAAFLADPRGFRSAERSAIDRLIARWGIATTALAPKWDEPPPPKADARSLCPGCNVVVFYVDTLRADAAHDPSLMPSLVRFEQGAVSFRDAYTAASDTVHALSAMTSGRFDPEPPRARDLAATLDAADVPSTLVIPESAYRYLARQAPWFRFDETVRVSDFENADGVFGYGADQPSASRLVDAALDRLARTTGPQLLWMFHFDVHNWQKLDDDYLETTATRLRLPEEADLNWRYRAAASGVDAEFGRFLEGLDRLGIADRTVVLFVSDHGEALGIGGFWVHSVFVWQALVRVPLAIRVPGIPPRAVADRVSVVDVLPTLAGLLAPNVDVGAVHGEDLLAYARGPVRRRLPLLLLGADKTAVVRVGLIEPDSPFKLDLPLATGVPELYDVRDADPDEVDVSEQHEAEMARMIVDLVRSPVFPR